MAWIIESSCFQQQRTTLIQQLSLVLHRCQEKTAGITWISWKHRGEKSHMTKHFNPPLYILPLCQHYIIWRTCYSPNMFKKDQPPPASIPLFPPFPTNRKSSEQPFKAFSTAPELCCLVQKSSREYFHKYFLLKGKKLFWNYFAWSWTASSCTLL